MQNLSELFLQLPVLQLDELGVLCLLRRCHGEISELRIFSIIVFEIKNEVFWN